MEGGTASTLSGAGTIYRNSDYIGYADDQTNKAGFKFTLPNNWDLGAVKLRLYHSTTNGSANLTNVFGISGVALASGDSITNTAWGTEVFVTNYISSANTPLTVVAPDLTFGNTPADNDLLFIRVIRYANNVNDVLIGESQFLGMDFQYLTDGSEPASW